MEGYFDTRALTYEAKKWHFDILPPDFAIHLEHREAVRKPGSGKKKGTETCKLASKDWPKVYWDIY